MPRPARRSELGQIGAQNEGDAARCGTSPAPTTSSQSEPGGRSHAATVHAITSLPGCTSPCWSTSPDGPNAQDEQAHHGDGRADAAYELSLKLADALERIADDQAWPRRIR